MTRGKTENDAHDIIHKIPGGTGFGSRPQTSSFRDTEKNFPPLPPSCV